MSASTTDLEKTSLEAHVDLCQMRYAQLDNRLASVERKIDQIQSEIIANKKSLATVIITSAGTIVVALIGVVTVLLTKL